MKPNCLKPEFALLELKNKLEEAFKQILRIIFHPLSTIQCIDIPSQLDILGPPFFLLSKTKANPKNNSINQVEVKSPENNASDQICQVKNNENSSIIASLQWPC